MAIARRFRFTLLGLTLLVAAAMPAAARADEPPPGVPAASAAATPMPVTLPDTAAGRIMRRVLASFEPAEAKGSDAQPLTAADFSDEFLAQVPFAKLEEVFKSLAAEQGNLVPVRIDDQKGENSLVVRAAGRPGTPLLQVLLTLNEQGKIVGLLFRPAPSDEPPLKNWTDFDDRLRALPGVLTFAAYQVRLLDAGDPSTAPKLAEVHTFNPDARLAIGSTFKLYVLGALAEAVQTGKARWDEPLAITDQFKSLPSGKMQNEAPGTEFPLSTYADLMISISDNTATDHLIHRIGRENVEAYMSQHHGVPKRNRPFLTTREMFALRLKPDPTLVKRWKMVDEATRRDMLRPDDMMRPTRPMGVSHNPGEVAAWQLDLKAAESWKSPRDIDSIEWFATAEECCRVMADLARRERIPGMEAIGHALRLNPGLPIDKARWPKIAFKGGSEPGVMNLTWLLTRDDGKVYAVSIGWNDPSAPLDESRLIGLAGRAIERIGEQP